MSRSGRERAALYLPEWSGPIEGYVVNSMKANYWRIDRTHERAEYLQEAHICFLRCAARYPVLDTPQHFMALFKRAWANQLNDLSNKSTRAGRELLTSADDGSPPEIIGEEENMGYALTLLRQAPAEVLMVLNLFVNAPGELLELAAAAWKRSGRRDQNAFISQLLGVDPKENVLEQTRQYFSERP